VSKDTTQDDLLVTDKEMFVPETQKRLTDAWCRNRSSRPVVRGFPRLKTEWKKEVDIGIKHKYQIHVLIIFSRPLVLVNALAVHSGVNPYLQMA